MTTAAPDTNGDDDFDKAFAGYAAGSPAADATPDTDVDLDDDGGEGQALADEDDTARQAAAASEEDPLAGLPEDARRRVKVAEERAAQADAARVAAEHAARSNAGRVSALQRKVDELQKSPRTDKAGGAADGGTPGDGSDTDDTSFGEEFSEVADFVQRTVEKKVAPLQAKLDEQEAGEAARQEQAVLTEAFGRLAKAHPDFDQIRNNPEYGDWLKKQAPGVRSLTASQDPEDAIVLCDLFKSAKGTKRTPSRDDLLAAAEELPSQGGSRKTGIPNDFDAAFDHYANNRKR